MHCADIQPLHCTLDPLALVAGDDNDGSSTARQHRLHRTSHEGFAAQFGHEFVLASAKPGRSSCCQNQCGNARGSAGAFGIFHVISRHFARLWSRGDLFQQTTHAHSGDVAHIDLDASQSPLQNPVETVEFGRCRATGRADDIDRAEAPEQHQISRIHRHAQADDCTARFDQCGRNDITAIHDRRGGKHDNRIGTGRRQPRNGGGYGTLLVSDGFDGAQICAQCGQPRGDGAPALVQHVGFRGGHPRQHETGRFAGELRDPHQATGRTRDALAFGDHGFRQRESDHLDGGDHLRAVDFLESGHGGDGEALVDGVEAFDGVPVDDGEAAVIGDKIATPGERCGRMCAGPTGGMRDASGGGVLVHVSGLQTRGDDVGVPRSRQTGDFIGAERAALLDHAVLGRQGMRENGARRFGDGNTAEFHDVLSLIPRLKVRDLLKSLNWRPMLRQASSTENQRQGSDSGRPFVSAGEWGSPAPAVWSGLPLF